MNDSFDLDDPLAAFVICNVLGHIVDGGSKIEDTGATPLNNATVNDLMCAPIRLTADRADVHMNDDSRTDISCVAENLQDHLIAALKDPVKEEVREGETKKRLKQRGD